MTARLTRRDVLRLSAAGAVASAAGAFHAPEAAAAEPRTLTVDTVNPGHRVSPMLYGEFFEEINYAGAGGLYAEEVRNRAFMDTRTPSVWTGPEDIGRVPGRYGSAVRLGGTSSNQHVELPDGIVSDLTDFTIAAWVNLAAIGTWARLFDFGNDPTVNMFLTVAAGNAPNNAPRFAITTSGNTNEQVLTAADGLPTGEWTHLAVTHAGDTGTLYVNGTAVDTNPAMTLSPADLGTTGNNWIGRSQYGADPFLDGSVDEFQIFDRALTGAEVASLTGSAGGSAGGGNVAWYRFDEPGGPTAVDSSGSGNDATIVLRETAWRPVRDGGASMTASLDDGTPLNDRLTRSLRLKLGSVGRGQRAGMANGGYFGIGAAPGRTYRVSLFAKASHGFTGPLTVSLEKADGSRVLASAQIGPLTGEWKRYTATLRVRGGSASTDNRLVAGIDNRGRGQARVAPETSVWLQVVSLFPETYRNRPNGLRPDLVEKLKAMRPAFLRFPGGNYVEGVTLDTRFDWKKTIGPIWERPGHDNSAWNYWSDDGLGMLEYLQLAEDLNATPIIGVFAGLSLNGDIVPEDELGPYVQDALDAIEYATGPVTSKWGARRAADGHPKPFRTPYIEIGNEDFLNGGTQSYDDYRYPMFYDAIKAKYPHVTTIATTSVSTRPVEVIDEHYYNSPDFFVSQAGRYDGYDRNGPKVFVGEYAVTAGTGNLPTGKLGASIGEAAFMTGMERNSDIVVMNCYAPLFAYVGHTQWNPDLIGFDALRSFGSTSYWVQHMFATNIGDRVLTTSSDDAGLYHSATVDSRTGRIHLKLVNPSGTARPTTVRFNGRNVTTARIEVLSDPDPEQGNTLDDPDNIVPRRSALHGSGGVFGYTAPANSLTVITIGA